MSEDTNLPTQRWNGDLEEYGSETQTNIVNLVPECVARRLTQIPEAYLGKSTEEMKELLKKRGVEATPTDNRLRIQFWREYEFAQQGMRRMHVKNVYAGVCSSSHFMKLLEHKEKLAWILTPPTDYMVAAEEALLFGIDQLREILEQKHVNEYGNLDAKTASVKLEIVKLLDQRVKGAVVQTTKNLHLHGNVDKANPNSDPNNPALPRMEDIDKELTRLRELSQTLSIPGGASSTPHVEKVVEAAIVEHEVRPRPTSTET